ncbi:MAG: hypothetical protein R3C14_47360 [Caldilineaceae bacterium]
MYTTVTIRDATTLKRPREKQEKRTFVLDLLSERVSVRELIRSRVYQEVQEYNAVQPEYYRGLVEPSDAERTLNGLRLRQRRQIDWEAQFEQAVDAFTRNGFLILVDDEQVTDLDAIVEVKLGTMVTFLKLVPLVGG